MTSDVNYQGIWDNEEIFVKSCGECEDVKYYIFIPPEIYNGFMTLLRKIKTEWLLYLTYTTEEKRDKDNKLEGLIYKIDGYRVPEQEVSSAKVDVLNAHEIEEQVERDRPGHGPLGVIHAHQFTSSTPSFSGTDTSYVNSNNAFSLVINKEGVFQSVARQKVPCGKWAMKPAETYIGFSENMPMLEELNSKIKEKTYSYSRDNYGPKWGHPTSRGYTQKSGTGTKSTIWNSEKKFHVAKIEGGSRRIKICKHIDDPAKCNHEHYHECEFYWDLCPKKRQVSGVETRDINIEKVDEKKPNYVA